MTEATGRLTRYRTVIFKRSVIAIHGSRYYNQRKDYNKLIEENNVRQTRCQVLEYEEVIVNLAVLAHLAQSAEHAAVNRSVIGSSPIMSATQVYRISCDSPTAYNAVTSIPDTMPT